MSPFKGHISRRFPVFFFQRQTYLEIECLDYFIKRKIFQQALLFAICQTTRYSIHYKSQQVAFVLSTVNLSDIASYFICLMG